MPRPWAAASPSELPRHGCRPFLLSAAPRHLDQSSTLLLPGLGQAMALTWQQPSKSDMNDQLLEDQGSRQHEVEEAEALSVALEVPLEVTGAVLHLEAAKEVDIPPPLQEQWDKAIA